MPAPPPPPLSKTPRSLHLAVFAVGLLWLLAARVGAESAAHGFARLLRAEWLQGLLQAGFELILLVTGFAALSWVALRRGGLRETNALPARPSALREWQKGAALGWAILLLTILPAVLVGDLFPVFWFGARAWLLGAIAVLTVLVGSLATEIAFRGFLFRRLIEAIGPTSATLVGITVYAVSATSLANATPFSFGASLCLGLLLSLAYLRTHGLWLGWGLRFGWLLAMGVLFGLPVNGAVDVANVVATQVVGRVWLAGGSYGPAGSLVAALVLLAAIPVLYRLTRDYAWHYTFIPIVPGGYPMDVPPPAAHAAMEAAAPPPLVQILGAVPVTSLLPARHAAAPPLPRQGSEPAGESAATLTQPASPTSSE